jgi:hypothetical protein
MTRYANSDLKLTFAGPDLVWFKVKRPRLPLLRWPNGQLCEPALYYFGHSARERRVRISSMASEAYTIREWFVFLMNKGLTVFDGSDELLEEWRLSMGWDSDVDKKGGKEDQAQQKDNFRIEVKVHRVFEFYRFYPSCMPYEKDGTPARVFVGENSGTSLFPIGSKLAWNGRKKVNYPVWIGSERVSKAMGVPKVPTKADLTKMYAWLRGKAFRLQQLEKTDFPSEKAQIQGDRNWLTARTIVGGGLRCAETSTLTVGHLAIALFSCGITKKLIDLDAIADDEPEKQKLVKAILSRRHSTEYTFINVDITGKGQKSRLAPFDISLVSDLLVHGVWGCRSKQIKAWKASDPEFRPPPYVFLSYKTKDKLDPGTLGDLIKRAFMQTGGTGSAHKLRAYFATVTAAAMWREYFAQHHYRYDQALVNDVLQRVATALGHSRVTTTITFYVNQPLLKALTTVGSAAARLFRDLWDIFVMSRGELSTTRANILLKIAMLLSDNPDSSEVVQVLEIISNDPSFRATPVVGKAQTMWLAYNGDIAQGS